MKTGYEIRTEILAMAKSLLTEEFHSKYEGWEFSAERDQNGRALNLNDMPKFPTLAQVLETAEQMYNFVTTIEEKEKPQSKSE
jgi:hypothetical protein